MWIDLLILCVLFEKFSMESISELTFKFESLDLSSPDEPYRPQINTFQEGQTFW